MHAFGLEETASYSRAEDVGRRARIAFLNVAAIDGDDVGRHAITLETRALHRSHADHVDLWHRVN